MDNACSVRSPSKESKLKLLRTAFLLLAFMAGSAHASLIQNGSFEDLTGAVANPSYGSPTTWQIYSSIPGWDTTQNLEIWTDGFKVPAYHGDNLLELNAHPATDSGAFTIYQDFATTKDAVYEVSFYARKRTSGQEHFKVSVGDLTQDITTHVLGSWTAFSYQFTATSDLSKLSFMSLDGPGDTTGNLIDYVAVHQVPEPGTLAMFLTGLLGLSVIRRRKNA